MAHTWVHITDTRAHTTHGYIPMLHAGIKTEFYLQVKKDHFPMEGLAPGLALKKRQKSNSKMVMGLMPLKPNFLLSPFRSVVHINLIYSMNKLSHIFISRVHDWPSSPCVEVCTPHGFESR